MVVRDSNCFSDRLRNTSTMIIFEGKYNSEYLLTVQFSVSEDNRLLKSKLLILVATITCNTHR